MSEAFLKNPLGLFDIKGKTAIITGVSGAFGALAAKTFAGAGANVVLAASKLDELKKVGSPIAERSREYEDRPKGERLLRESIDLYTSQALSTDDRFSHIPVDDRQSVADRCDKARRWLDEQLMQQAALSKVETPVLYAKDILKEREQLVHFCSPLLSKPKPTPKLASPETPKNDEKPNEEKPNEEKSDKPNEKEENKLDMDVD